METIIFTLRLDFSDPIFKDEIIEIADNIAKSLKRTSDTSGISPLCSDAFTESIEVAHNGLTLSRIDLI